MSPAENRRPVGSGTACAATAFAASRYLVTIAGDITSDCPVLVKPSPAPPSAGNSFAGSSESTPVRSRIV